MRASEIEVGQIYRIRRSGGRAEAKPRTVVSFDRDGRYPGGCVRIHSGLTSSGKQSQVETWSADYFANHVVRAHIKAEG